MVFSSYWVTSGATGLTSETLPSVGAEAVMNSDTESSVSSS